MEDSWRQFLYPLGFVGNLFFTLRFILQWVNSERKNQSHFTPAFWSLSLAGAFLMGIHSMIQVQYPVCIIQTSNAVLYWRNRELMLHPKASLMQFSQVCWLLFFASISATLLFALQSWLSFEQLEWMRTPAFFSKAKQVTWVWNLIGFIGTFLFASRFWIHWWRAEKKEGNPLRIDFWLISLTGSILSLSYFIKIADPVNILGYGLGLIPFVRNLFLMRRSSPQPR